MPEDHPLAIGLVSIGSVNASIVYPREAFKRAIVLPPASILVVRNHPSGDLAPSEEDLELAERLREAGKLLGIPLLDHVIVTC